MLYKVILALGTSLLLGPPLSLGAEGERFLRTETVADEPVTMDNRTGLMWQGCTAGLRGGSCSSGVASEHTWQLALDYCQDSGWGGHYDWYLPDIKELASIVDDRQFSPSIDPDAFPATPLSSEFWSSSSYVYMTIHAWIVRFGDGGAAIASKSSSRKVRCVRRGP